VQRVQNVYSATSNTSSPSERHFGSGFPVAAPRGRTRRDEAAEMSPPNRYQTMTVCCSPTTLENTNNFTPVVSDKTRLIENRTANLDWIWLFVPIKIMTAHKSLLPHVTIRIIAVSAWRFREGGEILTRRLGEMSTGVRVRVSRRKFGKGITY
jgi:hypothetical protein